MTDRSQPSTSSKTHSEQEDDYETPPKRHRPRPQLAAPNPHDCPCHGNSHSRPRPRDILELESQASDLDKSWSLELQKILDCHPRIPSLEINKMLANVDNLINNQLESHSMREGCDRPDDVIRSRLNLYLFLYSKVNADQNMENAGIAMAIRSHGLRSRRDTDSEDDLSDENSETVDVEEKGNRESSSEGVAEREEMQEEFLNVAVSKAIEIKGLLPLDDSL